MKIIITKLSIVLSVLIAITGSVLSSCASRENKPQVDVVVIAPENVASTFGESAKSAKSFYNLYNAAREEIKAGNYERAIALYNEALPHAGMGPEVSMVYRKLVEIYRAQCNLEKELYYLEQIPKYTMSDRIKKECATRAEEIRRQLSAQPSA